MTNTHTSDRPPSYVAYETDGCRCYQCAGALYAYNRDRDRAILNGRYEAATRTQT